MGILKLLKPAYSYIRFSHPDQAKGDSLRRQLDVSREYAAKNGFTLNESFNLRDLGISAFRGKNRTIGALKKFLDAALAGKIEKGSALIVESYDRLSRQKFSVSSRLVRDIADAGIEVHSISERHVLRPNYQLRDTITLDVALERANEESERKSERVGAAWKAKIERARKEKTPATKRIPVWMVLQDGKFVLRPDRARLIRRIFKLSANGLGKRTIAQILNREEIPTWGDTRRPAHGWHDSYIQKILHNPACIGEYQPHRRTETGRVPLGRPIKGYFPPVVDLVTWERVQAKHLKRRSTAGPRTGNLFPGLIKDGYSGEVMRFVNKGTKKRGAGKWKYFVTDNLRINPDSPRVAWNYGEFENLFVRFINEVDWAVVNERDDDAEIEALEQEAAAIKGELQEEQYEIKNKKETIHRAQQEAKRLRKEGNLKDADKTERGQIVLVQDLGELTAAFDDKTGQIANLQKRIALLREEQRIAEQNKIDVALLTEKLKDPAARLKLREEIRSKVERISLFPNGVTVDTVELWEQIKKDVPESVRNFLRQLLLLGTFHGLPVLEKQSFFLVSFRSGNQRMVVKIAESERGPWILIFDPLEMDRLGEQKMFETSQVKLARETEDPYVGSVKNIFRSIEFDTLDPKQWPWI
jgi:DNA invertase Pin-like site-specific DNA recombinase